MKRRKTVLVLARNGMELMRDVRTYNAEDSFMQSLVYSSDSNVNPTVYTVIVSSVVEENEEEEG